MFRPGTKAIRVATDGTSITDRLHCDWRLSDSAHPNGGNYYRPALSSSSFSRVHHSVWEEQDWRRSRCYHDRGTGCEVISGRPAYGTDAKVGWRMEKHYAFENQPARTAQVSIQDNQEVKPAGHDVDLRD